MPEIDSKFLKQMAKDRDFYRKLNTQHIQTGLALAGLNVLVFALVNYRSGFGFKEPSSLNLVDWGASYGPLIAHGEPWRLVTALFLHTGILHLLGNVFALIAVGRYIDFGFGRNRMIAIYLGTGLIGNLAQMALHPSLPLVGASGAVFGLEGALIGLIVMRHRAGKPLRLSKYSCGFIIYHILTSLSANFHVMGVANGAHVAGLMSGLAAAVVILRARMGEDETYLGMFGSSVVTYGLCQILIFNALPSAPLARETLRVREQVGEILDLRNRFDEEMTNVKVLTDEMQQQGRPASELFDYMRNRTFPRLDQIGQQVYALRARDQTVYSAQVGLYQLVNTSQKYFASIQTKQGPAARDLASLQASTAQADKALTAAMQSADARLPHRR